jgi:hypothetical protein
MQVTTRAICAAPAQTCERGAIWSGAVGDGWRMGWMGGDDEIHIPDGRPYSIRYRVHGRYET